MHPVSHKPRSRAAVNAEVASLRFTFLLISYLLLVAGVFGAVLTYRILLFSRYQEAVHMSHTASTFVRAYTGLDPTKTLEAKASLNDSISLVLDEKLPELIAVTFASFDIFYRYPALSWLYIVFFLCNFFMILLAHENKWLQKRASRTYLKISGFSVEPTISYKLIGPSAEAGFRGGWQLGCLGATIVCLWCLWAHLLTDPFSISFQGLLYTSTPAIGALVSMAWTSKPQVLHRVRSTQEKAVLEGRLLDEEDLLLCV